MAKIVGGPLVFLLILMVPMDMPTDAKRVIGVAAWMLVWWVLEAVPIAVTALLPILLFPLTGVLTVEEATAPYGSRYVFLFLGGFIIALALEKWKVHKRIALSIVRLTGDGAKRIVLGFMLASAFLSMWISNTATTLMMLPIAASVVTLLQDDSKTDKKESSKFALVLMLSIAYAANIGGIATLVGTPPNAAMAGILSDQYGIEVGFMEWMAIGLPFSAVVLWLTYLLLTRVIYPIRIGRFSGGAALIKTELQKLGKTSVSEQRVLMVFVITAALWVFRSPLNKTLGSDLDDTIIAIIGAVLLFVLPSGTVDEDDKPQRLLDWPDTQKLPWGILLLFGGGLALAKAFDQSGVVDMIASGFESWDPSYTWLLIVAMTVLALFLTELMSNLALVNIMVPVAAAIGVGMGYEPMLLAIPVTLASSCAFMLPMATPPNAIVFASGYIRIPQMARAGVLLNICAAIVAVIYLYLRGGF
jgi:solute carrier family 13 (sodium-dependent dicarboxylate transporter), member 2/3/5